jgi:hypothetical protein
MKGLGLDPPSNDLGVTSDHGYSHLTQQMTEDLPP